MNKLKTSKHVPIRERVDHKVASGEVSRRKRKISRQVAPIAAKKLRHNYSYNVSTTHSRISLGEKKTIAELKKELKMIEHSRSPIAKKLFHASTILKKKINSLSKHGTFDMLNLSRKAPSIMLSKEVVLPEFHNNFNPAGCLIGQSGATMKKICNTYKCQISILGSGSTRNKQKERELLRTGLPQHAHYIKPLHALIKIGGTSVDVYTRLSRVLKLINKVINAVEPFTHDGIYFDNHKTRNQPTNVTKPVRKERKTSRWETLEDKQAREHDEALHEDNLTIFQKILLNQCFANKMQLEYYEPNKREMRF